MGGPDLDRVDGRAKVTGTAEYAAEKDLPGLVFGVLVGSNVTRGTITAIDTKAALAAPGVLAVITHANSIKVPGYDQGGNPAKGRTGGQGLQVFNDNIVRFNGQPIALVVADTFERATHAASLVRAQYSKEAFQTDLGIAVKTGTPAEGPRFKDNVRGIPDAYKSAPVFIEGEYRQPIEVHNPMELHATTVQWEGEKVTVWEKTQGVKSTQRSIMQAFGLPESSVQVYAPYVGGGFGSALRTWPHAIAALIGAKMVGRPLRLVLRRDQMFTLVGYRPETVQRIGIGATPDGKFTGITHEATSQTSNYETFTEGTVNISRALYACPNVTTRYKVYPLDLSTPTWMRGPGEATGAFALESAIDELAHKLGIDPLELRLRNYAETDPERNVPFSSKFLKEAYALGADRIGWKTRNPRPRSMQEGGWLVGYGLGSGLFHASRNVAKAAARLYADGTLLVQSAVADSGPGTATAMTQIASDRMGLPPGKVTFQLGDSSLPPGPTQGGSTTTSTLGSAVFDVCRSLQQKLAGLVKDNPVFHTDKIHSVTAADLRFEGGAIVLASDPSRRISYTDALKAAGLTQLEATEESKGSEAMKDRSAYSYSVHFVKVRVHPRTGVLRTDRIVIAADAGTIVSPRQAESQMIGGAVGGIGMALMEEGVVDHRYGRWVNNNFADYHVPVHADVPPVEVLFVGKPDPLLNPTGAKGLGEIAIIGFAAAMANAVFHATGKRIRSLPITPDKLLP
ncbi:MAG: xanthine dehydrogenase family protein molybdopterin-binding subunit [Chitinophagaceae bacterium]|nr:MAG: xanthine dehydrogenase family protein molybdopterin-binding subunit [Chitinophagaceae bacterium]